MSAKAICERDGKAMLARHVAGPAGPLLHFRGVHVRSDTNWDVLVSANAWLLQERLVVKPDQLIKRRGKLGLVGLNLDLAGVRAWLAERMGSRVSVGAAAGTLSTFLVEPFVEHRPSEEFYVCVFSKREGDEILFHHEGGVDVGDVDAKAVRVLVPDGDPAALKDADLDKLLTAVAPEQRLLLKDFLRALYAAYVKLYFTYLEINPLVVSAGAVHALDLAAKIDQTADYLCKKLWGEISFPPPFGREATPEEAYIADLDSKSGASLKLTVLNRNGRIWTMVAGGGASVIYSDTICDLGFKHELANYGEYSGAPSESQTYEYAKTIVDLMTRGERRPDGKVLIIGGGIANFTNVADTFKGIVKALSEFRHKLIEHSVVIYVRRGGPNYQEGLRIMRDLGRTLGVPIYVYGPETHMTAICAMAVGLKPHVASAARQPSYSEMLFGGGTPNGDLNAAPPARVPVKPAPLEPSSSAAAALVAAAVSARGNRDRPLFTHETRAVVFGMQPRAVQSMLDFDNVCQRERPSVACMVYPFGGDHMQRFYWGRNEIMVPVYAKFSDAMRKHADVDVMVNFASLRSAYDTTVEAMEYSNIRTVAIIAEGIPENITRRLNAIAARKGVTVIGPATVGGIKPGGFKIGNTGGMLDNIIASKLYRPGSVSYVSRSGGMSNELNNIISRCTNGVCEGIAIGGDRYPGTTFLDHLLRYEHDPDCKMFVLLGEVGGVEEYHIIDALRAGRLTKPLVAWCIGTCAGLFNAEVQFGHAGACANADLETAVAKNAALCAAGVVVPDSFDGLGDAIAGVYERLVREGIITPAPEPVPPTVPIDYEWAQELGLIRKPASFVSSICDERGEELLYAGVPISTAFKEDIGVGGVMSLLWFKRRLPSYACKFFEMCLMITADHGPAVSGAHNTIVTSRAGRDLVSSVASGLLTIGDRFGGALDGAARQFSEAYDKGMEPHEFVTVMRDRHELIQGIGHRVKSINNPDKRVELISQYARDNFPRTPLLDYARKVEAITTSKKPNLILNVDGCIAVCMVDLVRECGAFTADEARECIEIGTLNGLFVLGRTIGFIGHHLDQKRLKQGLYRHPWDDISYVMPELGLPTPGGR